MSVKGQILGESAHSFVMDRFGTETVYNKEVLDGYGSLFIGVLLALCQVGYSDEVAVSHAVNTAKLAIKAAQDEGWMITIDRSVPDEKDKA